MRPGKLLTHRSPHLDDHSLAQNSDRTSKMLRTCGGSGGLDEAGGGGGVSEREEDL